MAICSTLARWGCLAAVVGATACTDAAAPVGDDAVAADAAVDAAADATSADAAADAPAEISATTCPGGAGCDCQQDADCDDGDPCTANQTCANGACTAGTAVCDDGSPCTTDACDATGACSHSPASGGCEDGDPCTIADTCAAGTCTAGKPRTCDDSNACTQDVCQTGIGCVYLATAATCVDENACAFAGVCALGHCVDGKAKPCDDGSPCTWDTCMPETGCTSWAVPLTSDCTDTVHGGRCWKAIVAPLTWADARVACHAWGGELAAARSLPDNTFVRDLATATCGAKTAWLGLSDHAQEGHWHWSDAVHGGFANWADGEPNNAGGSATNDGEDFGAMGADGTWNDVSGATVEPCLVCARPLAIGCDAATGCTTGARCQAGACLPATATASCDDGNACTADACAPGQGCGHTALDGVACGAGTCTAGVCLAAEVTPIAASCAAIAAAASVTPSDGVYWLDPDGAGPLPPFQAWCDLHADGGGWTLAMKIDGADPQFAYGGDAWLKPKAFGSGGLDGKAAVLPSAWALPITAIRVGFWQNNAWRWLTLPVTASALQAVFIANQPVPTTAGLPAWEALLADGSLQSHCQLEGFNIVTASTSLRIGIQGNNENDCGTVDSWIGVGAASNVCGMTDKPVAGDVACYGADNGNRTTQVAAAILVR